MSHLFERLQFCGDSVMGSVISFVLSATNTEMRPVDRI